MYNSDKNKRPKLNIPNSNLENILGIIAALVLLTTWIYLIGSWGKIPRQIPTHFGFSGKPDSWGNRGAILTLPIITSLLYILLTITSKFPQYYNYIVDITEENAKRQYQNARTLMAWMAVEITVVFSYLEWKSIQVAMNKSNGLAVYFLPIFLLFIFGTLGFYTYRMFKLK
jgi:Protein of unknown function (DUF1648).